MPSSFLLSPVRRLSVLSLVCAVLAACSPSLDWREVRGSDTPYVVLLPAKPSTHARTVRFGGTEATMTMTAAEVDGAVFAVGSATLPDAGSAAKALQGMKAALVGNIGGTVRQEKTSAAGNTITVEVEAAGSGARPRMLHARLVARGPQVYQVLALGDEKALPPEAVSTFLGSFRLP